MASSNSAKVCRLCRKLVESKRAVGLFTTKGLQQQWASRIQTLLSIPVNSTDGLPGYICDKCKLRLVSLEKAAVDLKEFKQLASCSMSALARVQCPVKRSKCTSSDSGVSPDTAKERPRSKLSRKKLDFDNPPRTGATGFQIQRSSHSDQQVPMTAASPVSLMNVSSSGDVHTTPPPRESATITVSMPNRSQSSQQAPILAASQSSLMNVSSSGDVRTTPPSRKSVTNTVSAPNHSHSDQQLLMTAASPASLMNVSSSGDVRTSPPLNKSATISVSTPNRSHSGQQAPMTAASPVSFMNVNSSGDAHTTPPSRKSVTITVSTPNRAPFSKTLGENEGKIARQLLGGHVPSIAKAVMAVDEVRERLFCLFLDAINNECINLCQRSPPNRSLFRNIPPSQAVNFKWSLLVTELQSRAPLLFKVLSSIASRYDHKNQGKVGTSHHPGICMAAAVILKERNRQMCGVQSVISLLMYSCHCEKKAYERLNHVNVCVSYPATLALMEQVSTMHSIPIKKWIKDGEVIKFWGDNVDKQRKVRDVRSDHQGQMIHMYSVLVGKSRTPAPELSHSGQVSMISQVPSEMFLPTCDDVKKVKSTLVILVSRVLTQYIAGLAPFSKAIPKHIVHRYSNEMSKKSEVVVLDVLMKNETKHTDMIEIMNAMHEYLGSEYNVQRRVLSGGDLLTYERQVGSQKDMMCGDTPRERLEVLEPVVEDWHCLVSLLQVLWKALYNDSACNHGTLRFFRNKLNRTSLSNDPKKQVDATIDFLNTIVKGHWVACACNILNISDVDGQIVLPSQLLKEDFGGFFFHFPW